MPYTLESAEEFEQAYLHLAHLYVDRGKFDLAQVRHLSYAILDWRAYSGDNGWLTTAFNRVLRNANLTRCVLLPISAPNATLGQDLCRRCLSYNKSCSQAWETMGLVMEKEQSYRLVGTVAASM